MYTVLEKWTVTKDIFDNDYIADGISYESKYHMRGEYVRTKPVFQIKRGAKGYIVQTIDNKYFLLKPDEIDEDTMIFSDNADMESVIKKIEERKEKIKLTAEKLLSAGDCIISKYIVCYRSKESIEILKPKAESYGYKYTFPKEKFSLTCNLRCFIKLQHSEEYENGSLYEIDFENGKFRRHNYKHQIYEKPTSIFG